VIAKRTPLVVIDNDNNYRRYVGKTETNHVISDRALLRTEVELFRKHPAAFISVALDPEVA